MRSILTFLVAILISVAGVAAPAQRLSEGKREALTRMIEKKMSEDRIPGLSIAVGVDGAVVWSAGFGKADVENDVLATTSTVYRTASIGKPMTATAVMQLASAGQLDLDAPIQAYCPAFPRKRWPITTRQLLAHLSGIRHYGGENDSVEHFSVRHYGSVVEALDVFKSDSLLHEPGAAYTYSTYGYDVLGCVIEGAAGVGYMDYMRRNIFEPAGMTHTRDDDPAAIIPHRSRGYVMSSDGTLRNCAMVDMSNRLPAGGFVTTADDLVHFAFALMSGELIGASTFAEMLTPQKTSDGTVVAYGLGWALFPGEDWYGEKEAFHGGSTPGASGVLYLLPGRHFAVAILTNLEGVHGRTELAASIAKEVLDLGK